MKKINLKSFITGCLFMAIVMVATFSFAESNKIINAIFNRVKVVVNGENVNEETILYNGTTFVPLRAIGEMLGKDVEWESSTNTAYINDKDNIVSNKAAEELSDEELKWMKDIAEQEVIDRFTTSDNAEEIEKAMENINKITTDWVGEKELLDKKEISCFEFSPGEVTFSTTGFISERLYTIKLPSNWNGGEITVNKIRVKKIDNKRYYFVDDLIEVGVIKDR